MSVRSDTAMLRPFYRLPEGRALIHAYWMGVHRRERDVALREARLEPDRAQRARHVQGAKSRHALMVLERRDLQAAVARLHSLQAIPAQETP